MIDDLDRIMDVMGKAFDPSWGEAWTRRQVGDSLEFPHTHYRLVGLNGELPLDTGAAAGFTLVRAAPGEEELLLIGVVPEARGRGLGAKMLDDALDRARLRGATRMFLEMRENNPARSLYERHGFRPIGRRPDYYRLHDGSRMGAITFGCSLTT